MPNFACRLLTYCVRVAALDELDATSSSLVDGWRNEDMDVIGHYDECVELESALIAITEECCDEEFGVCGSLEMTMMLECGDCYGV